MEPLPFLFVLNRTIRDNAEMGGTISTMRLSQFVAMQAARLVDCQTRSCPLLALRFPF